MEADGCQKETKKVGLIDSFFQPIRLKGDVKSTLGNEKEVNLNQGSGDAIRVKRTTETEITSENNEEIPCDQEEKDCNRKTNDLSEKGKLTDSFRESSEKEPVKSKRVKPKWSVTCAVRNSSICLSSSGSDFEEDGSTFFVARTKKAQKAGKKKAKTGSGIEIISGVQEFEGKSSADDADKESKPVSKTRKLVKSKGKNDLRSKCHTDSQKCSENAVECVDSEDKGSKPVGKIETQEPIRTSEHGCSQGSNELDQEKYMPHEEAETSSRCETKEVRTSAFDILMKSQRPKKQEESENSPIEATNTTTIPTEDTPDSSCCFEVITVEEKLQSKASVTCQSKSPATEESSSDKIRTTSSSETNAFEFLMRKGRLGRSPCGGESQVESELDSEASENIEGSLKKKLKKKSFEFQLSIRASEKKEFEFSLDSESIESAGDNYNENSVGTNKRKTKKHKKNNCELAEGITDEIVDKEKCRKEGEVSKSKKGKKKSKIESNVNIGEDAADVSLIEVSSDAEEKKVNKGRRKSQRKSSSTTEAVTVDVEINEALDDKDFEPPANTARMKAGTKDKNVRKKRKRKESDSNFSVEQLSSTECQQISVRYM